MTDYAKLDVSLVWSPNSDYSAPTSNPKIASYTLTPLEGPGWQSISATTAGGAANTVSLATLASASKALLVIKNEDTTNYVSVTCRAMGDADDAVLRVHKGEITCLSIDPVTNLIFQANTATVLVRFAVLQ